MKADEGGFELAERSDFVSLHVPLREDTRALIGERFLRAFNPQVLALERWRHPADRKGG